MKYARDSYIKCILLYISGECHLWRGWILFQTRLNAVCGEVRREFWMISKAVTREGWIVEWDRVNDVASNRL